MKTIWKYPLQVARVQHVRMPEGAKVLCVHTHQQGQPTIWCEVTPGNPLTTRVFNVYGTGWDIPDNPGRHIGTVHQESGLVWHFYEAPVAPNEDDEL